MKLLNRIDELKLPRRALADAAGVSERTVYRWLGYEVEPQLTFDKVAKLCTLLEWTIQELAEAYYPPDDVPSVSAESAGASPPK